MSASLSLLTGCLEVEDDNNAEIAKALEAQNQLLNETINQVGVTGVIVNAVDGEEVSSAIITVISADEVIHDGLEFTGGEFKLENLPVNSDIELIISSSDDSFLTRAFFVTTSESTANDLGSFTVSESNDVQVAVINTTTGLPFAELEFVAYSHSGNSSRANKYRHVSSYDEVNGVYTITLPKFINTTISANLDIDKDGEIDFTPESNNHLNGNKLYYNAANTQESLTLYIEEKAPLTEVEYRITLIDESANALSGALLLATGSDGVESNATFDEVSKQYVISAKFTGYSRIELPSFTVDGIDYQSAAIAFSKNSSNESIYVNISGTSENCCYYIPNTNIVELAIMPRVIDGGSSPLEVVTAANEVNVADHSFSVFYSQPVNVPVSSISLTNTSAFTVVKGNDDANDVVLAGTTVITGEVDIPVLFSTSLNSTKLTITPVDALSLGNNYAYSVGSVVVSSTEQAVDISGDYLSFTIESNEDLVFDINEVRLDNNSYTTNGLPIVAANTAGNIATPNNFDRNVYFYLPSTIETLQSLSLRLVALTQDGVSVNAAQDYTFVSNGSPSNIASVGLVKLAENETLVRDNVPVSIHTGTAQADSQKVYRAYSYQYLSDDLNGANNDLTFEYAYETKAGDVATGTITIPVQ